MGGIIDKITEFIKELLQGWVLTNFETMFTDVNDKVGTIAGEVSKTPSTWNSGIFDMIKTLSDNVMIPIAGMIISFVLVYELISMVIDKNNLHDFNTAIFIRFFMKACIAVMLLSKTFDIVMAVFDVGSHIVNSAASAITGSTSIDVASTLQTMFNEQFSEMSIGELLGLGMETMIVSLCMKIMSVLITVILYGRMIEIYLYVSVAPVPCATVTNREWGTIGTNYFKGLCALAFQGFFMMVCVAIYAVLVAGVAVAGIPLYFLTKGLIGTSAASLLMMGAMLPFFFFAMYEKNGFPAEKIVYFMLRQKILTPGIRPYRSENLYKQLEEKEKLRREVCYLEEKAKGRTGKPQKKQL